MSVTLLAAYGFVSIAMVFIAYVVSLLQDVMLKRNIATWLVVLVRFSMFFAFTHFSPLPEFLLVAFMFLKAEIPKEWSEIDKIESSS